MRAYDIAMLSRAVDRADPLDRGWCFDLPPGIAPEQWPLDPHNGWPLMHGFTLLLPDDYRCHGPEIVAISFFMVAPETERSRVAGIAEVFAPDALRPGDPDLAALWARERDRHPRLHRIGGRSEDAAALILLTPQEYGGKLCGPPDLRANAVREERTKPSWLRLGSAAAYWELEYSPSLPVPVDQYALFRELGGIPAEGFSYNRALRYEPRGHDPSAGVPPCDLYDKDQTGYQQTYAYIKGKGGSESYVEHGWSKAFAANHIGGTMNECQAVPRISPYYVGFQEYLGGYNFGGGSAQLDFRDMKLEWACG